MILGTFTLETVLTVIGALTVSVCIVFAIEYLIYKYRSR